MRTRFILPDRWPWALGAYAFAGALVALSTEPLVALATRSGAPAQVGIVVMANVLYPLGIIACAIWFPRVWLVPLGALLALIAFTVTRGVRHDWHVWLWPPGFLFQQILHPVIVVGSVVSVGLGMGAAALIRPWRRVGLPDEHERCPACGYLLRGVTSGRCPECGAGPR